MSLAGKSLLDAACSTSYNVFSIPSSTTDERLRQLGLALHQLSGGVRAALQDIDRELEALRRPTGPR